MNTKFTLVKATIHGTSKDDNSNFLMLTQKPFKNGLINKIMLHYKVLPAVLEQMQNISKQLFTLNEKNSEQAKQDLFVDEWDLNSPQSVYRMQLARIYAKTMSENIDELSRKFCEGCNLDYPGQKDHDCLMMPDETKIENFYCLLFENIDESRANKLCYDQLRDNDEDLENKPCLDKEFLRTDEAWANKVKEILRDLLENNK